ncbi:MAG: biotin/lipoyl-binding protein, partial [Planctomycetaceae bacterium]|nr:biotin/lipoyl-binding protein [Planctomycetaceae bacterium]
RVFSGFCFSCAEPCLRPIRMELEKFESRLLRLEELLESDCDSNAAFTETFGVLHSIAPFRRCTIWHAGADQTPVVLATDAASDNAQQSLNAVTLQVRQAESSGVRSDATAIPDHFVHHGVTAFSHLADRQWLIIEAVTNGERPLKPVALQACSAVAECLAQYFRRVLLERTQERLKIAEQTPTILAALRQETDGKERIRTLARKLVGTWQVDRASILHRSGSSWSLLENSGTAVVEREGLIPQRIEAAAAEILAAGKAEQWVDLSALSHSSVLSDAGAAGADAAVAGTAEPQIVPRTASRKTDRLASSVRKGSEDSGQPNAGNERAPQPSAAADTPSLRTLALHGTTSVRLIPLDTSPQTANAAVFLECFSDGPPNGELSAALDNQTRQLLAACNTSRLGARVSRRLGRKLMWLVPAVLFVGMLFWQRDFEVTVSGQMLPTGRIHIFAPSDGTVEDLKVDNDVEVNDGDVLLRIRDDNLLMEIQRVTGDLRTEETRLVSLQRSRTLRNDQVSPVSEAAAEQRVADLRRQFTLLEEYQSRLTIVAAVSGRTQRANLRDELLSRPVRRGQILFDLVPEQTDWEIELLIPDRLIGYVRNAMMNSTEPPCVRFFSGAEAGPSAATTLSTVESFVEPVNGEFVCRGYSQVPADLLTDRKWTSGASVTARILCGKRSAAFIALREVVEFVREKMFEWM